GRLFFASLSSRCSPVMSRFQGPVSRPSIQHRRSDSSPPRRSSLSHCQFNLGYRGGGELRPKQRDSTGDGRGCRAGSTEGLWFAIRSETCNVLPRCAESTHADREPEIRFAERSTLTIARCHWNDRQMASNGGASNGSLITGGGDDNTTV